MTMILLVAALSAHQVPTHRSELIELMRAFLIINSETP